tara:strand:- start:767 stop:1477 length:711 start_codon:yes stop_codon:yes gene_type:complete
MKIIGTGFLAKGLKKIKLLNNSNNFIFYAAGVSNSNSKINKDYIKDKALLKKNIINLDSKKVLVYFSSLSIINTKLKKDKYVENKIFIEKFIKRNVKNYLIIRLPQVIGKSSNPNTLTNFLYKKIKSREKFIIWNKATRYLIDIDDIILILQKILSKNYKLNSTINIANLKADSLLDIVKIFEQILFIRASFKEVKSENKNVNIKKLNTNTMPNEKCYIQINNKNYLNKILRKYYK